MASTLLSALNTYFNVYNNTGLQCSFHKWKRWKYSKMWSILFFFKSIFPALSLLCITENYISQASCPLTSARGGQWEVLVEYGRVGEGEKLVYFSSSLSASWGISRNSCFSSLVLSTTTWASLQGLSSAWHRFHDSSSH